MLYHPLYPPPMVSLFSEVSIGTFLTHLGSYMERQKKQFCFIFKDLNIMLLCIVLSKLLSSPINISFLVCEQLDLILPNYCI